MRTESGKLRIRRENLFCISYFYDKILDLIRREEIELGVKY